MDMERTSTSNPSRADITNGTIRLQADQTYTGKINYGIIDNSTGAGFISFDATINNIDYSVESFVVPSQSNDITVKTGGGQTEADFSGPVECSSSQGGGVDTTQSMVAGAHKMEIEMEYLTLVIDVQITHTIDALKKEIPLSKNINLNKSAVVDFF